jgi:hypothetical protein
MNRIRRIAAVLAALAATAAVFAATGPAAFAMRVPAPGLLGGHPVKQPAVIPAQIHTVIVGGMPGWQITLIAAAAALLAAVLAVLGDRSHAARRRMTASA